MNKETPILYILMRSDLDSMNAGKGMAQAAHAANAFVKHAEKKNDKLVDSWINSTKQGFGTTIVLAVDGVELQDLIDNAQGLGLIAGIVHDPSYPVRDGSVTHLIPLDTCGYVFGSREFQPLRQLIGSWELYQ